MLPKQLKYGSKVESAAAKSSRVNIAPNNGTGPYNLGDTMIINMKTPFASFAWWTKKT